MAEGGNLSRTLSSGSEALIDHECTQCRAHGSQQEATDFCQDCKELFCNICRIHHVRYMKAHTLASVASLQQSKITLPTTCAVADVAKCQFHPDRDIEMYCGTHDIVYCFGCIAMEHRSCLDVKQVKDVAHISDLSTLQSLVAKITRVRTQLHSTKLEMSNDLKLIQKRRVSLLDEIKALRKQFNKHLDALELKLIAELDEEQNKLEKEIGDASATVDDLIIASDKIKPDMTSHLDEKQIFITENLGQGVLADANIFLKKANVLKYSVLKFEPNDTLCDAIEKSDRMGKLNIIDTKQKHMQCSNNAVKKINTKNVRVSSDKEWCHINGMCQLTDGTTLLIDCNNDKLKRLDDQLDVKDFLDLRDEPGGLCSVSPNEVAVRLKDGKIYFISVGESLTDKRNVSIDNFNNANYGMACCNNQLWIPGVGAVYVYSLSGTLVKKIETDSQGRNIFPECSPRHIAVSNDGTGVYVTAGKDRVVVFNSRGDVIKELRDQGLDGTRGICITKDDVIFVAGYWSKNVVMFDRDGNSLGELVSAKDMLTKPRSLFNDSKRCCLLAGCLSDQIQTIQLG